MTKKLLLLLCLAGLIPASVFALDCSRRAGNLPNPALPAGTRNEAIPIRHVLVIMQENHSFDNYFGALNDPRFYGKEIDGVDQNRTNIDSKGKLVHQHPETNLCIADPNHGWNAVHRDWDGGKLDGFVRENDQNGAGSRVMGYYGPSDIPYYYALANQFTVGDRYFCAVLSQTFPNRFYLMAGTSFGHILNDMPQSKTEFGQKTIFDLLTRYGISWKYYSDGEGYLKLFQPMYLANLSHLAKISDYEADLAANRLPEVSFLDSSFDGEDEHPDADVQVGQAWVAARVNSLIASPEWNDSALFLTYDENGGFYDHVAPPAACAPDATKPNVPAGWVAGDFAHDGFRVPFLAVSPYAKHHFVTHSVYDHTSILRFIETKFNLPALTARDANANPFSDVFDYAHPVYSIGPLPKAQVDASRKCSEAAPPVLPNGPVSLRARKTGLCLESAPDAVRFAACDGGIHQQFVVSQDIFGTYQVKSASAPDCLRVNWKLSQVDQVACTQDEDEGFELEQNGPGRYLFSSWHGDYCFAPGSVIGSPLKLSACAYDGSNEFELRD